MLDLLDHQLRDPVAPLDFVRLIGVGVDQQDLDLVARAGVDEAWRVETRDAMAESQSAPGLHEAGVARRDGESDAGGNEGPSATRRQDRGLTGQKVAAAVVGPGIRRQRKIGIETEDGNVDHSCERTIPRMLVWMDLEMTGLDPAVHTIVEIASLVTDDNLEIIAEGPDLVVAAAPEALDKMEDVVRTMHTKSGLLDAIKASTTTLEEAGEATLAFIRDHVSEARTVPLCGNSIGTDRRFLALQLPEIENFLHYRSIDVSTVKELARRWYPDAYHHAPKKAGGHRALDDIRESVAELRYYRETLFKR